MFALAEKVTARGHINVHRTLEEMVEAVRSVDYDYRKIAVEVYGEPLTLALGVGTKVYLLRVEDMHYIPDTWKDSLSLKRNIENLARIMNEIEELLKSRAYTEEDKIQRRIFMFDFAVGGKDAATLVMRFGNNKRYTFDIEEVHMVSLLAII